MPGVLLAVPFIVLLAGEAHAFEKLEGFFVATAVCDLPQSMKTGANPGDLLTEPNEVYEMIGTNSSERAHFQIRIPDAPGSTDRWVDGNCGMHVAGTVASSAAEDTADERNPRPVSNEVNVLALSWQSAFCEHRPRTRECELLNDGALPMAEIRFSVHGLWPQPRDQEYCGVSDSIIDRDTSGRWRDLPDGDVSRATLEALAVAMPGALSSLHRHEWIKHGTCYNAQGGADEYFSDTLMLTNAVNASEVGSYVAGRLGEEVRTSWIRQRFDEAFGAGAGDRVEFVCSDDGSRRLLRELRISLRGEITENSSLGDLMLAASPVDQGCKKGIIDTYGLQ
ncbi:ribonuclease T2 family protein [Amaricoccus macauensis]|uniref:ribonuclease T2 family protein n=1 Tax=Amaricoccus macauensis TaxID=57001 RepID=UPI003C7C6631